MSQTLYSLWILKCGIVEKEYLLCLSNWSFKCPVMPTMAWEVPSGMFTSRSFLCVWIKKFWQYWVLQKLVEHFNETEWRLGMQFNTSCFSIKNHFHELENVFLIIWLFISLKLLRVDLCSSLKSRHDTEPFLYSIATTDEKTIRDNHIRRKHR